jgi:hypothetical protein
LLGGEIPSAYLWFLAGTEELSSILTSGKDLLGNVSMAFLKVTASLFLIASAMM